MTPQRRWMFLRITFTFVVLYGAWILFSFDFSGPSLIAGALVAAILARLTYGLFIEDYEAGARSVLPRILPALAYLMVVVFSMYVSSVRVFLAVCRGKTSSRIVHFRSRLRSDLARVVLAESITFTPGTIVLDLDEDHLVVHWLFATTRHSSRAGEEIKGGFERVLRRVWG